MSIDYYDTNSREFIRYNAKVSKDYLDDKWSTIDDARIWLEHNINNVISDLTKGNFSIDKPSYE